MTDALNAEVSLGTITNVQEAMQWLSYTYLFGKCVRSIIHQAVLIINLVRMKKNPWVYGQC